MGGTHKVTLRLTDDARRGLDRAAITHGVTLTALAEALGRSLDENTRRLPPEVVEMARVIDAERRNRR